MKKQILITVLLFPVISYGNEPFKKTLSGVLSSGKSYFINIEETKFNRNKSDPEDDGGMWGIDGGFPYSKINKFNVMLSGNQLFISRKYYSDICCINNIKVIDDGGNLVLKINGGDASGSYRARYKFSEKQLIARYIFHGEFPEEITEKIIIKNLLVENPDEY